MTEQNPHYPSQHYPPEHYPPEHHPQGVYYRVSSNRASRRRTGRHRVQYNSRDLIVVTVAWLVFLTVSMTWLVNFFFSY